MDGSDAFLRPSVVLPVRIAWSRAGSFLGFDLSGFAESSGHDTLVMNDPVQQSKVHDVYLLSEAVRDLCPKNSVRGSMSLPVKGWEH